MKIAAVTLVRNDRYFLDKWVQHYGAEIGTQNLFLIVHGSDWELPPLPPDVSRIVVSDSPGKRAARNQWSAKYTSDFVTFPLESYAAVIRADSDEYIVADPAGGLTLSDTIEKHRDLGCISALRTDVIQKIEEDPPLIPDEPVLTQRRHGIVTREFSKPCIVTHPVRWDAGYHHAHGQELRFVDILHLFHLALHDRDVAEARLAERTASATSQSLLDHVADRMKRFTEIDAASPIPGDEIYASARAQIAAPRQSGRIRTRPGFITEGNNVERGFLIKVPDRFGQVL